LISRTEVFRTVRRKGGKVQPVHFNVDVTIALRRWLWQRKEYPAAAGPALFLSDRGRRLSSRAVEIWWPSMQGWPALTSTSRRTC